MLKRRLNFLIAAIVLMGTFVANANLFGQEAPDARDQQPAQVAQHQKKLQELQQALDDKAGYADAIVRRWEASARASGKWDRNYSTDLHAALMKLRPETLVTIGEASSYEAMLRVLAKGPLVTQPGPASLGDFADDLVYTPVPPCRIADTRIAGGQISGGTVRQFDADGSDLSAQGGSANGCGIPSGVASAIAISITAINPANLGYLTAFGLTGPPPTAATMIYYTGELLTTTTISPMTPTLGGADFSVFSSQTTHLAIDVIGYFAAPVATALDCVTVSSAVTAVGLNSWTAIDANCPAGRTATGGGYDTPEGTLGYPNVWLTTRPNGNGWRTWVDNQTGATRSIQTFAQCCRIRGR